MVAGRPELFAAEIGGAAIGWLRYASGVTGGLRVIEPWKIGTRRQRIWRDIRTWMNIEEIEVIIFLDLTGYILISIVMVLRNRY